MGRILHSCTDLKTSRATAPTVVSAPSPRPPGPLLPRLCAVCVSFVYLLMFVWSKNMVCHASRRLSAVCSWTKFGGLLDFISLPLFSPFCLGAAFGLQNFWFCFVLLIPLFFPSLFLQIWREISSLSPRRILAGNLYPSLATTVLLCLFLLNFLSLYLC